MNDNYDQGPRKRDALFHCLAKAKQSTSTKSLNLRSNEFRVTPSPSNLILFSQARYKFIHFRLQRLITKLYTFNFV